MIIFVVMKSTLAAARRTNYRARGGSREPDGRLLQLSRQEGLGLGQGQ